MAGRVLFIQGDPAPSEAPDQPAQYKLLQLPNPSTGQAQQYILTSSSLLEVNRVKHAATCWLVGNTFMSDGSAFMATPVNVVHVLLATLGWQPEQATAGSSSSSSMFQEADSLLCSQDWPAAQQLVGLAQQHLPCICDVKAVDESTYYRLNSRKVLAYLRVCVTQTLAAFRAASPSSIAGLPEPEAQAYVLRFLREYMSAAWHDQLLMSYGLQPAAFNSADAPGATVRQAPAAAAAAAEAAEKKQKVVDPKEVARKKAEASRAAAAAAKLKQQAAGTKKISSFFTAKKPK